MSDSICTYCNCIDSILHFLIDCKVNNLFCNGWVKWWHSMTSFSIRNEPYIHESIPFGFPGNSNDVIVITYCILFAKQFIYKGKLKTNSNQNKLTIDFLVYLSHLKYD